MFNELIWILKGHTDANILDAQGIKVWNDNTSRRALDSYGFKDRSEG